MIEIKKDDLYCICETVTGITHIGILMDFEFYGIALHKPLMLMMDDNSEPFLDSPMFAGDSDGYLTYSNNMVYTMFTPNKIFKELYVDYVNQVTIDDEIDFEDKFVITDTVH